MLRSKPAFQCRLLPDPRFIHEQFPAPRDSIVTPEPIPCMNTITQLKRYKFLVLAAAITHFVGLCTTEAPSPFNLIYAVGIILGVWSVISVGQFLEYKAGKILIGFVLIFIPLLALLVLNRFNSRLNAKIKSEITGETDATEPWMARFLKGCGKAFVVIVVVGFCGTLISMFVSGSGQSSDSQAPTPRVETPSVPLEEMMAEQLQKLAQKGKQATFDNIHPVGTAKSIKVHAVEILGWKNGIRTNRMEDIVQFKVRYTLYWSGPVTDDGFTKIEAIYDAESQKCVSSQILATNGVTNGQAAEAVGYAAGMLLREAMSDSN